MSVRARFSENSHMQPPTGSLETYSVDLANSCTSESSAIAKPVAQFFGCCKFAEELGAQNAENAFNESDFDCRSLRAGVPERPPLP
ncbi:unnamed protein product [Heligmosomoides polygyrus]|uniref:Uncharacterized protein n=1 Tax=Heligmosomoides polygyrus TaxID=6339 RepID=A0A183GM19_HELPZ|nr:unnamed protein product [Heligmosomoides polygyrus]